MNKKTLYILIISSLAILTSLITLMLLTKKAVKKSQPSALPAQAKKTEVQDSFASILIKDFKLKELEKGKEIEFVINAQECNFIHTSDTIECTNVICTLFDHKILKASLKTNKAFVNRIKKTIFLSGAVIGNMKNLTMHGSDINYDFSLQTLTTDKPIMFTHPDFSLNAHQSFVDLKNNTIQMSGGIVNEFTEHDKQQQP